LLKLHQKYFDAAHKFEKEQFVVAHVELLNEMLGNWKFEE
jgi:hypothetical protein